MLAISFNIAVMHAKEITNRITKKHARSERLNYVTNYYSSNRRAAIAGTVPSAAYLCRLIQRNHRFIHAAAN